MNIQLPQLAINSIDFPSPTMALAEPNGLLAFGGDLSSERLINAYRLGIFPWFSPGQPLLWWSPSPRAVFYPHSFSPAKSVKKFQRKHGYRVTINHATPLVIHSCAALRPIHQTWITDEMQTAYVELAKQGHCHSVEVWDNNTLVGGLYGIQVGQLFCGESMFSLKTNASKIALWYFCSHFQKQGGKLIDCQMMNPHLLSLGAKELERYDFMSSLSHLREHHVDTTCFLPQELLTP